MKNLKFTSVFLSALTFAGNFLQAEEAPVCPRCQIIREENAKKGPPKYKYYEDYLKAQDEESPKEPDAVQHEANKPLSK